MLDTKGTPLLLSGPHPQHLVIPPAWQYGVFPGGSLRKRVSIGPMSGHSPPEPQWVKCNLPTGRWKNLCLLSVSTLSGSRTRAWILRAAVHVLKPAENRRPIDWPVRSSGCPQTGRQRVPRLCAWSRRPSSGRTPDALPDRQSRFSATKSGHQTYTLVHAAHGGLLEMTAPGTR